MTPRPDGRLELTWVGKDKALIATEEGRYGYDWVEPDDPRATEVRQLDVIRRIGERTGPTGADENLLVIGDSADVLRSLATIPELADRYLGKVKLCYIDPPFNTGGAFGAYDDALEHSIWLTMMRDRLRLIKRLLSPDGSIWVHLDDSENHRMRVLLDEEFGAGNFVAEVIWQSVDSPSDNKTVIADAHETITVYGSVRSFRREVDPSLAKAYPNLDARTGQRFRDRLLRKNGKSSRREDRPSMWFPIEAPDGSSAWPIDDARAERRWAAGARRVAELLEKGEVFWRQRPFVDGAVRWVPYTREWATDDMTRPWSTLWADLPTTRQTKAHLKSLDMSEFDTPKPERLLERVIHIATNPGDLVLDCFAGSGTTAAVAHKMGRRWVTCELIEQNVERYTLPRLVKVVDGEDSGGISTSTERVAADGVTLPDGVTPKQAKEFNTVLTKVAKSLPGFDASALKALRAATRTRDETAERWSGGGGFTLARLAPSMYEVVDDQVFLSEAATNGAWAAHVAGQLRFRREDAPPFCGRRGRRRLAVVDGFVRGGDVEQIVAALGDGETVRIVCKAHDDSAVEAIARARPGSTIERAPDYLRRSRRGKGQQS